jgi:DNA adenine methylase
VRRAPYRSPEARAPDVDAKAARAVTKVRPILRYHGGKWMLAPWIIGHFPPHRIYVEPFGGAASVLLRKDRSYAEIYNDLDDDIVNLFRVMQHSVSAQKLVDALKLTPFARAEFELSYEATDDKVEQARRLIIRSLMGFGSDGHNGARPTGFRNNSNRSGTTPAHDWASYPDALPTIIDRLRGIVIEHRDAKAVMANFDGDTTLHYVDPPYAHETRSGNRSSARKNYVHEMSGVDHVELLACLCDLKGYVILSGYANDLYDATLTDWLRIERAAYADGAKKRTEVLWINPRTAMALPAPSLLDWAA